MGLIIPSLVIQKSIAKCMRFTKIKRIFPNPTHKTIVFLNHGLSVVIDLALCKDFAV